MLEVTHSYISRVSQFFKKDGKTISPYDNNNLTFFIFLFFLKFKQECRMFFKKDGKTDLIFFDFFKKKTGVSHVLQEGRQDYLDVERCGGLGWQG